MIHLPTMGNEPLCFVKRCFIWATNNVYNCQVYFFSQSLFLSDLYILFSHSSSITERWSVFKSGAGFCTRDRVQGGAPLQQGQDHHTHHLCQSKFQTDVNIWTWSHLSLRLFLWCLFRPKNICKHVWLFNPKSVYCVSLYKTFIVVVCKVSWYIKMLRILLNLLRCLNPEW